MYMSNPKEEFYIKASQRSISKEEIDKLWKRYLKYAEQKLKKEFYTKAREKKISTREMPKLWEKYLKILKKRG